MTGDGLNPDEALSSVRATVEHSQQMPTDLDYIEQEPGDENRDITLPVLVFQPLTAIRLSDFNTDFDGYVQNDAGDDVGRVFAAEYRLGIQLDIWTASGSSYSERTLGNKLHDALYPHDTSGPGRPLLDENGNPIDSVWKFQIEDGTQANDLTGTPTLRRWRQDVALWSFHRFDTTEDYVATVDYPSDLSDSDGDGTLEG